MVGEKSYLCYGLLTSTEDGLCNTDAGEALANVRPHQRRWSLWGIPCDLHDPAKHACVDVGSLLRRYDHGA